MFTKCKVSRATQYRFLLKQKENIIVIDKDEFLNWRGYDCSVPWSIHEWVYCTKLAKWTLDGIAFIQMKYVEIKRVSTPWDKIINLSISLVQSDGSAIGLRCCICWWRAVEWKICYCHASEILTSIKAGRSGFDNSDRDMSASHHLWSNLTFGKINEEENVSYFRERYNKPTISPEYSSMNRIYKSHLRSLGWNWTSIDVQCKESLLKMRRST